MMTEYGTIDGGDMAEFKDFKSYSKYIEKAVNLSTTQSLNKAVAQMRTQYAKNVVTELGMKSTRAKARARLIRATKDKQIATLSIGTRVLLAAQDFPSKVTKVMSSKGKRKGVDVKLGKQGTVSFTTGPFLAQAKNGKKIIISRKSTERYGTTTVLLDVFLKSVSAMKEDLQAFGKTKFEQIFNSQIKYNLEKK